MGGCRCTYRNCSVRSDGKTHMFHYPVYDKVRCHQWILNANRHEFFNLTVSQVRNKVVCQHHFKDDYFMNYKKEKLKFEAVPTENGPYCDSKNDDISNAADKIYPSIGKIEKDIFYLDKKANSSLKYVDFLTKLHVPLQNVNMIPEETDYLGPPKVNPKPEIYVAPDAKIQIFQHVTKNDSDPLNCEPQEHMQTKINIQQHCDSEENRHNLEVNNIIYETNSNLPIQPLNDPNYMTQTVHIHPYYDKLISVKSKKPTSNDDTGGNLAEKNITYNEHQSHNMKLSKDICITKEPKVKIISEKQISEPLPFIGKLEPVSPSLILRVPRRKKEIDNIGTLYVRDQNTTNKIQEYSNEIVPLNMVNTQNLENVAIIPTIVSTPNFSLNSRIAENESNENSKVDTCNNVNDNLKSNILDNDIAKIEIDIDQNYCVNNSQTEKSQYAKSTSKSKKPPTKFFILQNKSILKSKINPERIAAIEKKRIFNKKLRDMVESCLEKSDTRKSANILKAKDSENIANNGGSAASNELRTVSFQEHTTMASLEARIKKMEDMLAKKIELNSERILELKNCFNKGKSFTVSTQTCPNEESYKKYLYSEISQYLSPNASSLVYEELFINKYAQKESVCEPKIKRRKRSQKWR